ncbi:hypothetical protein ACP4OV_005887 [Aristida adscensionis]
MQRLFDVSISFEDVSKEIEKCTRMAGEGIQAFFMVFSATSRFSKEDSESIEIARTIFGEKIFDHMILIFTYGDLVHEAKLNYMLKKAPRYLKDIAERWNNRIVLLDSINQDEKFQEQQREKLFAVVGSINKTIEDALAEGEDESTKSFNICVDALAEGEDESTKSDELGNEEVKIGLALVQESTESGNQPGVLGRRYCNIKFL